MCVFWFFGFFFFFWGGGPLLEKYTREDIVLFRDECLCKMPANGEKLFPKLSLKQLLALPKEKAKKISARRVGNRLGTVRQVFAHALARGLIAVDPCATVKDIKAPRKRGGSREDDKAFTTESIRVQPHSLPSGDFMNLTRRINKSFPLIAEGSRIKKSTSDLDMSQS